MIVYTIEIEKNYFCDTLHPFPTSIKCPTQELFKDTLNQYRDSLKQEYSNAFEIEELIAPERFTFSLHPKQLPTNFLNQQLHFNIAKQKDLKSFWDYFSNPEVKNIDCKNFTDLIGVVYGVMVFSMPTMQKSIDIIIKQTAHAYVIEIEGIDGFCEESLKVLLKDNAFLKYHLVDGVCTLFASKQRYEEKLEL